MTPAPLPGLQTGATGAAGVVVVRRGTLVLYLGVQVVEARGQGLGGPPGLVSLQQLPQPHGVELVDGGLPGGERGRETAERMGPFEGVLRSAWFAHTRESLLSIAAVTTVIERC